MGIFDYLLNNRNKPDDPDELAKKNNGGPVLAGPRPEPTLEPAPLLPARDLAIPTTAPTMAAPPPILTARGSEAVRGVSDAAGDALGMRSAMAGEPETNDQARNAVMDRINPSSPEYQGEKQRIADVFHGGPGIPSPPPSDPISIAKAQVGPQQKRHWYNVLGDAVVGLAGGGVGGAILGAMKGGDWRYQNNINRVAGQIGEQQAHDRQTAADTLNAKKEQDIHSDRELAQQEKDRLIRRQLIANKLQYGVPLSAEEAKEWGTPEGFVSPRSTPATQPISFQQALNIHRTQHPDKYQQADPDVQKITSSISANLQKYGDDAYGKGKGGHSPEEYQQDSNLRDLAVREQLKSLGKNPGYDPRNDPEAMTEISQIMQGGQPNVLQSRGQTSVAPVQQPQPAAPASDGVLQSRTQPSTLVQSQPYMAGHQQTQQQSNIKFNPGPIHSALPQQAMVRPGLPASKPAGKGRSADIPVFEKQVMEIEATAPGSTEAQKAREALNRMKQRAGVR
jgi:hypothetical protein